MIYSEEMAQSQSLTAAYVTMTGSPYAPKKTGKLRKIMLFCCGDAATSLIEGVMAQLTNPAWGVPIVVATVGAGIRTAPAKVIPVGEQVCDAPVTIGSNIDIQLKNITAGTPVTPRYILVGVFEG